MKVKKSVLLCLLGLSLISTSSLGVKAVAADFLQTPATKVAAQNVTILQGRIQTKVEQLADKTAALKQAEAQVTQTTDETQIAIAKARVSKLQAEVTKLNEEVLTYQAQIKQLDEKDQTSLHSATQEVAVASKEATLAVNKSRVVLN